MRHLEEWPVNDVLYEARGLLYTAPQLAGNWAARENSRVLADDGGLVVLDDQQAQARLDKEGMLAAIRDLPRQCQTAWEEAQRLEFPPDYREVDKVVVLGMGGSAIAGDYLRVVLAHEGSRVIVANHRDYGLPPYVDDRTLLIASSYSGNTEETVTAFQEGLQTKAKLAVITTGGRLLSMAQASGLPTFHFEYESAPRAALGYSLMPLLAMAQKAGILDGVDARVIEAIDEMQSLQSRIDASVALEHNRAKQIAVWLHERLPVIYGAGYFTEVAHRWKTQLNESAKVATFYETLPEANHNALVSYNLPKKISRQTGVVFLRSASLHPRVLRRYEFTQRALAAAGVPFEVVEGLGRNALAQMLTATLFGDYVSYYLAMVYGVAPTPLELIDQLKRSLADG